MSGVGVGEASSVYLSLEVRDDQLFGAIAAEAALGDPGLDAIERELLAVPLDPGRVASLGLTLGRAGRASSGPALSAARARLEAAGHPREARAVALAEALLEARVPAAVERAERGYRHAPPGAPALFVEDPIAAHWHQRDRWGPPIRPARERPGVLATPGADLAALLGPPLDGRVLLVPFRPSRLARRPAPVLRLTRAGFARTADLSDLVRWSAVRSVGRLHAGRSERAACETTAGRVDFPPRAAVPLERLLELMGRLLKQSRS